MKDINLNDLDLSTIGSWPAAAKAAVVVVLCIAVLGLGYMLDTRAQLEELERSRAKEVQLKQTFEKKQAKAVNLDAYRKQMEEMEQSFGAMLRQLPSKTEVESLLVDISQTGLASGIEFQLFRPAAETHLEFYAEQPINMTVKGSYHEFGAFAGGVAALPRIVTLHNIALSRAGGQDKDLTMTLMAKTYRYLDEDELAARKKQTAQNQRKGR